MLVLHLRVQITHIRIISMVMRCPRKAGLTEGAEGISEWVFRTIETA
jgi:hypothetical protein